MLFLSPLSFTLLSLPLSFSLSLPSPASSSILPPHHSPSFPPSLLPPLHSIHPQVSVFRVDDVQGKEFRALLLSTVRTCSTEQPNLEEEMGFLTNPKVRGHERCVIILVLAEYRMFYWSLLYIESRVHKNGRLE